MARLSAKLSPDQLGELKIIIKKSKNSKQVSMAQSIVMLDRGMDSETIKLITEIGRSRSFALRRAYLKMGISVLDIKQRGINRILTRKQLEEIVTTVKHKKPEDVGFPKGYEYWSTSVLGKYIEDTYHVLYKSKTSYYLIFKRVRFTFHKPGRVYQRHSDAKVEQWKQDNKERIQKAYSDPATIILCEDEMKLSNQTTFQKIWLPVNEYPKVEINNKKEGRSIYGFLNIKTGEEHAFKTSWQNMYITKEQLKKIREIYPTQHILLLWDGPGSHKGKEVTNFLEEDKNIEVIYFQPYAPELNPQEHVWREGRKEVTHNHFLENIDTIADQFVQFLKTKKFPYKLLEFKSTFDM